MTLYSGSWCVDGSLNMHLRDESVNMEATSSLQEKVQAFGCSLTSHSE